MSLLPNFGVFDVRSVRASVRQATASLVLRPVYAVLGDAMTAGAAWLYESIMGRVAPGAAWTVAGHDHADYGGWPICRGSPASFDVGDFAIGSSEGYYHTAVGTDWEVMNSSGEARTSGYIRAYASPGIDSEATWGNNGFEAKVCYIANAGATGAMYIRLYNEVTFSGSTTGGALTMDGNAHWLTITDIPCRERTVNEFQVQLKSATPTDDAQVLAVIMAETVGNSQPDWDVGADYAWNAAALRPF